MDKNDIKILEDNGWIVVCESPFEIENESGDCMANGEAAQFILSALKANE